MPSRRLFVSADTSAAAAAAAGGKVESLALHGGAEAVSFPADRHSTLTKWPRYRDTDKQAVLDLVESNRYYQEIPLLEKEPQAQVGVPLCKAHCKGTSALMSMFFALDLPAGSEILVPSYTASATIVPMRFSAWCRCSPISTPPRRAWICITPPESSRLAPAPLSRCTPGDVRAT